MLKDFHLFNASLETLQKKKLVINTINAHSYIISKNDTSFKQALLSIDILLPDGISIVWAIKWLIGQRIKKIAGADLFFYEMKRVEKLKGTCFFLGSSETTLQKIKERAAIEYPSVQIEVYSPPFKPEFTKEENNLMLHKINTFKPDVLFIGMTAPKQEKWAYQHFEKLNAGHICSIGAVFDFYAGTLKRAPKWMINLGLEWLYRFVKEPKRLWKRYLMGNVLFIAAIVKQKIMND